MNAVYADNVCADIILTDLIVDKDGDGEILVEANVTPTANMTFDLGTAENKWDTLHIREIEMCGNITGVENLFGEFNVIVENVCANTLQINTITGQ